MGFIKVLILVATLLVIATAVKIFVEYKRLRHVPGPWYTGVTQLWLAYRTITRDVHIAASDVINKYGTIARIAPNIVATSDPDLIRMMEAPRAQFTRGSWFDGMKIDPRIDNLVSMADEKAHAELRSKMIHGYTGKEVPTLELDIDTQVLKLINLIKHTYVDKEESFDLAIIIPYFTLDVLSQIAFSTDFGFLKNNRDMFDYHETLRIFLPVLELACNIPIVMKFLQSRFMQALAGPKPSDKVGLGVIMGTVHAVVAERFGPDAKSDRKDMLQSFKDRGLSQVECESESIIQIMAGSDSTSTAIRMTFWHIMCNPPVYSKLLEEMRSAMEQGKATHPVIRDSEAKALPYLQACIREGLRMYTPLNGLSMKVVPAGGLTWKGIHIPEGAEIATSLYAMHHRTDIFGTDADTFRPERFLQGDPERIKEMERVQELVFGSGRHGCLGKPIALIEIGKVIFELFRNFDFAVVDPLAGLKIKTSGISIIEGMRLRAWRRIAEDVVTE